ncbi:BZ3500_MvSof-1268-A1-R1_Chr10-1g02756 [Microbotryum saponariae]|uniref:BZ3500_MvSof-1268-A1-R1_Chr10-1g02756 protein n=1 Tax=Microbotryum saponariae TaxID=289078 RepID=A0A2X0MAQ4_9BASI|nr:BZ3500_MvSof-1268-A1-R1_Chr10-1g02756 [Microbotryum saponariae]SDA06245.1 BZ3501_MvSof-1269-A2-R1_Chr10-1g02357 [Microbotryum saponariae]
MSSTAVQASRKIVKSILSRETPEGAGAIVRRSIGTPQLRNFTPFLMLDHFNVGEGGFPDHPHRGMSTITYMLEGSFKHEDFMGHAGTINAGDLQFMTAGKGILHAEMPVRGPGLPNPKGLQLWVDLPKAKRMTEASYQELKSSEIPSAHPTSNTTIKVISGTALGNESEGSVTSPIKPPGGCWIFDVTFKAKGEQVFQAIPAGWNAFAYTLEGQTLIGGDSSLTKPTDPFYTVVLSAAEGEQGIRLESVSEGSRLVLIAGEPLDQEIIQYGPFVMDTEQGIRQAFQDFQMGVNGFEKARGWQSEIGKPLRGA